MVLRSVILRGLPLAYFPTSVLDRFNPLHQTFLSTLAAQSPKANILQMTKKDTYLSELARSLTNVKLRSHSK